MGFLTTLVPNPWAIASREGRAVRLGLLAEMARKLISDPPDPDAVLRLMMDQAPDDMGLDACLVHVADNAGRVLRSTYTAGLSDAFAGSMRVVPYGEGLSGLVAKARQPLIVADVVYNDVPEYQLARRYGVRAYAGFPLLSRGSEMRLMGVLSFVSKRLDRFSDEDLGFLAMVASHVEAVHQRNHSERALRDSEARFRTLADTIPQLAWMARPDGWIFWYNKRWHDYTGTTLEETEGWGWRKVQHPDHLDRVAARLQQSWETGEPWEDTFPMRGAEGQWRWFLSRARPVRNDAGQVVMWFGTNTDVTEQREAEEALMAARDEAEAARRTAEQATRTKSRFLAAASHDLRQPLQSMLLLTGVLEGEVDTKRGRDCLVHLQRGMDALKVLLDGLLDVSRLDAGVVTPEVSDFRIYDLCDELTSIFQAVAAGKGVAWRVGCCDHVVRTDRGLLGRILRNLVENAVRYTASGHVAISCSERDDTLAVTVEDTGIGIPADHLDRIWEEFHQVGNSERDRGQGTGLGLAIVRRLSDLLGLNIQVTSRPGEGSRFTVLVPLGTEVPEPMAAEPVKAGHGRLALVIDDDAMILLGLQAILREWGYEVMIAGSVEQALEQVLTGVRPPDVVVSDYRLRGSEVGTDAIAQVRRQVGIRVPGIVLTGEAGQEAEAAAAQMGLAFVHKPVTPRQLAAALEACVGKS